jgi:glycosyltransferase involved in cell wall biosynthesis
MGVAEKVPAGFTPTARADVLPAKKQAIAKRHICFVAPHAWPVLSRDPHIKVMGGAEVQQSILARLFVANGYRVSMITIDFGQPDRSVVDGVTVHKTFAPEAGVPVLRFLHPRITSMWRKLREVDADIYYCRSASIWLWLVTEFCRRNGKRSLYAGASDVDFLPGIGGQIRYARDRGLYRRGLAAADAIVAQNEAQRASCRTHYGREAVVIPSCYELPAGRRPVERDCVLWVAMVQESKRPELLLDLAARLPQRRFVMIGGPRPGTEAFYERIRARAATLPNVEFKGFLPLAQAEPWFDRARVFVNTSVYEGMPNTFLQAWARGVPTLATVDVGAPGAYTMFQDCDRAADEIQALFTDELRWRERSAACRGYFAQKYAPETVLEQYGEVFQAIAA